MLEAINGNDLKIIEDIDGNIWHIGIVDWFELQTLQRKGLESLFKNYLYGPFANPMFSEHSAVLKATNYGRRMYKYLKKRIVYRPP